MSKARMWSELPMAVIVTCGTSPTSTRPAGSTGASIRRLYLWSWVGFCAYATTLQSATANAIANSLSRRFASRNAILPGLTLPTPDGERWPMQLGAGLQQGCPHLPQPVRVEVAEQLSLVRHGDLTQFFAEDQDNGVRLHREAEPGAVAGSHPLPDGPFLRQRKDAPRRQDLVPPDDDGAVVEGRVREEDRLQEFRRELAIDPDAAVGVHFKAGLLLEDDQGAGETLGQLGGGPDHLVDHPVEDLQVVVRHRPSDEADPAKLVEGAADLRLEEDDDADQDGRGGIAEDPREQPQVEQVRQQADQGQQQNAEHQLDGLGSPNQEEQAVEEERHQGDVDEIEDMSPDVPALEEHQDVAQDHVH